MSFKIEVKEKGSRVVQISLTGNLDTNTYQSLEKELETIYKKSPEVLVFDLKELE